MDAAHNYEEVSCGQAPHEDQISHAKVDKRVIQPSNVALPHQVSELSALRTNAVCGLTTDVIIPFITEG